ncbi:MAG TPA: hypothetical protein VJC16_06370, partial [Candidatus Nanoarchaeia archaeon]|nr:hypothetical protein [Candidatus Nanoarchaeia archaeon]
AAMALDATGDAPSGCRIGNSAELPSSRHDGGVRKAKAHAGVLLPRLSVIIMPVIIAVASP